MENKVYVIIVTYNALKWVDKCFTSLRESEMLNYPVIIDNCSKDETVSYIIEHYPEVHIIQNKENRGFGQANNQGIEYAYKQGATHFFLLNQDAWVHPDTLGRLVEVQDKYNIALVAPIHLNGSGEAMDYQYFAYAITEDYNNALVSDLMLDNLKPYYKVSYINAAGWMLSRRCIEKIGGFDPIFFHYGEDRNYCQRLKYHHEEIAIVPKAYMHHDRKINGNDKVYNERAIVSLLLKIYTDINQREKILSGSRVKFHLWQVKNFFVALFKLHFKECGYILQGYGKFFRELSNIKKSRSQNKKEGANWLSLTTG